MVKVDTSVTFPVPQKKCIASIDAMSLSISKKRLHISNSQAWGAWASLLFLISWLDKTSLAVPRVGDFAVLLMGITLGGFVVVGILNHRKAPITICIIAGLIGLLFLIYGVSQVFNPLKASTIFVQLGVVMLCFIGAAVLLSREQAILILAGLWTGLSILNLVLWVYARFPYPFQGVFAHKNLLGGLTAFSLFFVWIARSTAKSKLCWNVGLLTGLVVVLASGSRATWLTIVVAAVIYILWPRITANKWIFSFTFLLMLLAIASFVFIYINLSESSDFSQMRALVTRYTGQRLNSGRNIFWPFLIDAIQQRPWGYGPGATLERLGFEATLSAHNSYIQVTLQAGVGGLVNLVVILWAIWMSFFKKCRDDIVRLAGAFLIATLVHESFEVSLIQNNLTVGIVMWTIFGIGVGRLYLSHAPAK